jgi:hypothetical protein
MTHDHDFDERAEKIPIISVAQFVRNLAHEFTSAAAKNSSIDHVKCARLPAANSIVIMFNDRVKLLFSQLPSNFQSIIINLAFYV